MINETSLDLYFQLIEKKPALFTPSQIYPIVTDKETIETFSASTGKAIGVVYKSDYHLLVVDLIRDDEGGYFTYERILSDKSGRGVVCIPEYQGKYILLKQYRHPIRGTQICFPRGFGEDGLDPKQNAEKELLEEIGASVSAAEVIGNITIDSGFIGSTVDILLCKTDFFDTTLHSEGILEILMCTYDEIKAMISNGQINDSFTICAFSMLNK